MSETVVKAAAEDKLKEVTMEDGSVLSFSLRANKRAFTDADEGSVTFALATGVQHKLNVTEIPFLSNFYDYPEGVRKLIVEGLKSRIVATINNKPDDRVSAAILNAFESFRTGVTTRLVTFRKGLTLDELAYAMVVNKYPTLTVVKSEFKTIDWDDLTSHEVIKEVKDAWGNMDKKTRRAIRLTAQFKNTQSAIVLERQESEVEVE